MSSSTNTPQPFPFAYNGGKAESSEYRFNWLNEEYLTHLQEWLAAQNEQWVASMLVSKVGYDVESQAIIENREWSPGNVLRQFMILHENMLRAGFGPCDDFNSCWHEVVEQMNPTILELWPPLRTPRVLSVRNEWWAEFNAFEGRLVNPSSVVVMNCPDSLRWADQEYFATE